MLAPYAADDTCSKGRAYIEPSPGLRSEYQRDRDRIIHSSAFRRLEYKTQVFVNHEGDMFRTRLTHSIEVAQIARSIARRLMLNEDLTEAIALAHDLGHTPFGHAGQDALNKCMADYGGFEHNLQSLRVVDKLEEKYAEFSGLNLTFETREGILKHCSLKKAAELGEIGERFVNKHQPSLEAQLTNIADEIAYNNHDVDDGLRAQLISIEQLCEVALFREQYDVVRKNYPEIDARRTIHEIVRRMINQQVTDLIETTSEKLSNIAPVSIDEVRRQNSVLITFSDEMREKCLELKRFLRKELYQHYRVRRMSVKAERTINALYEAFINDPKLLPTEFMSKRLMLSGSVSPEKTRVEGNMSQYARSVADYIAGMTDRYAIKEYERIYNPSWQT